MKKIICVVCSLLILISLAACAKQPAIDPQDQTSSVSTTEPTEITEDPIETTAPEEEMPIIPQPMVSVSLPMQNESITDDEGNVLLYYNTQYMILSMSEQEIAERITVEFLNRIDETVSTKDSILSSAKSAHASSNNWTPYQYTVAYTPKRIDNGVMSLLGCNVSYLGAHIDKVYHSVNYSMITGHNLSLLNIITDNDQIDILCQLVIDTLTESKEQLSLHEDFSDTVKQHFSTNVNDAWFFSASGLCFFFSPYDIAPYSAGVVVAEIPYEKLIGILKDDYFPAEQANAPGTISIMEYSDENLAKFSRFPELSLSGGKNKFLLCTDKAIHDITVSVGTLSANGMFIEEYTAYALSSLTLGDTIVVEADLADARVLQIRYCSGEQMITENVVLNSSTNQVELYTGQ